MIQFNLALLILVDGALAGFRSGAGRNPRIYLWDYYRACMVRGVLLAVLMISSFSLLSLLCPHSDWADLLGAGARMIFLLSKFAWLGLAALSIYLWNVHEMTVLATVILLGPMTLARPWVIALAGVYALHGAQRPFTIVFSLLACLAMLMFERLLEFGDPPWIREGLRHDA
jgi:hypothetical protein